MTGVPAPAGPTHDIGVPLDAAGYLRVILAEPVEHRDREVIPRRVNMLAGWQWTDPQRLRDAAAALLAAADWLDTPTPDPDPDAGDQLTFPALTEEALCA